MCETCDETAADAGRRGPVAGARRDERRPGPWGAVAGSAPWRQPRTRFVVHLPQNPAA